MAAAEPPASGGSRAVQPVPAPLYRSEYQQLLAAGVLIDRAGRPVSGGPCATCDGLTDTYTCPGALPCPHCRADRGQRCQRPSGHTADRWHAARIDAADAIDQQREDADDPSLLAPWPE
jgi:hypothetical protein